MNKILIEVGHIYLDEKLDDCHKKAISICQNNFSNYDAILLLDDLNIKTVVTTQQEIIDFYKHKNCKLDYIRTEKGMIDYALRVKTIMEPFLKREFFRKEGKYVYFFVQRNKKIPLWQELKTGENCYGCYFLSLCWLLFKINYFKDFVCFERQVAILPQKFQEIENNVLFMMSCLNIKNNVKYLYF